MSAFMCSEQHISAIINGLDFLTDHARRDLLSGVAPQGEAALPIQCPYLKEAGFNHRSGDSMTREQVYAMLAGTNRESMFFRYPQDRLEGIELGTYSPSARVETILGVINLIDSLSYQSCEHPGWKTSGSKHWTAMLKECLVHTMLEPECNGEGVNLPWSI